VAWHTVKYTYKGVKAVIPRSPFTLGWCNYVELEANRAKLIELVFRSWMNCNLSFLPIFILLAYLSTPAAEVLPFAITKVDIIMSKLRVKALDKGR